MSSKITFVFLLSFLFGYKIFAQTDSESDSIIKVILSENTLTGDINKGAELMLGNNLEKAGSIYTDELSKDAGNKAAYFNRGVVNWATSKPENACRDWSSLLALGDTAAFKLLDKNCHGNMIIDDDTIPKKVYRKLFAQPNDVRAASANPQAINIADQMPQFLGGDKGLISYLGKSIVYPADARQKKVEGMVYVSFIITKKGNVAYPYVVRGIHDSCNKEALRVIKAMPAWQAGKLKGKPVMVRYTLPVRFSLK